MRAVAAVAVASPVAVVALSQLASDTTPQHRQFVQAALVTDLPNELLGALSQGLSQFGVNLPPMPTGVLTGTAPTAAPGLTSPGLTPPGGLGALTSPSALTPPGGLTAPSALTPGTLTTPGVTAPGVTTPLATTPGLTVPPVSATTPGLTTPGLTDAGLTNPALTNPALTSPLNTLPGSPLPPSPLGALGTPATGLGLNEVPISAPVGLDAGYPMLGDPSMGLGMPAATGGGSGGLLGDLSSAAQTLGASQAIDLLKGMVMPMITGAMQNATAAPAAAAAAAVPPAPAA
jgi:hypothetical protein